MIKIVGNELWRSAQKIGWINGDKIFAHSGELLGYFRDNKVYDHNSHVLGYIEGDYLKTEDGRSSIHLEDNRSEVTGGTESDLCRAAIRLLLGN